MALVTRHADASMDASTGMYAPQITGLVAGEDLDVAAPCYINADGKVYMTNATAANAAAKVDGFTPRAALEGEPVAIYGLGARFRYAAPGTLTPGATLFAAATAGRLDTAATTGDPATGGTAVAVSDTDIRVIRVR